VVENPDRMFDSERCRGWASLGIVDAITAHRECTEGHRGAYDVEIAALANLCLKTAKMFQRLVGHHLSGGVH
jgi:hypothetical protein